MSPSATRRRIAAWPTPSSTQASSSGIRAARATRVSSSELSGPMTRSRANLFRYPPGAIGRRHIDPVQEEVFVVLDGTLTIHMGEGDDPERHELERGSVLVVQPGTALQLSNRGDDELRLFIYGAPPERGEATFLPTIRVEPAPALRRSARSARRSPRPCPPGGSAPAPGHDLGGERARDVRRHPLGVRGGEDAVGVGEEDERRLLPAGERVADLEHRGGGRVVGLGRDELREGERARLRLAHRERRVVAADGVVVEVRDARDLHEPARGEVRTDLAHERAEAEPRLRRRADADAGVEDHEPRDAIRVRRPRSAARSARPSRGRRSSALGGRARGRAARSSERACRTSRRSGRPACPSGRTRRDPARRPARRPRGPGSGAGRGSPTSARRGAAGSGPRRPPRRSASAARPARRSAGRTASRTGPRSARPACGRRPPADSTPGRARRVIEIERAVAPRSRRTDGSSPATSRSPGCTRCRRRSSGASTRSSCSTPGLASSRCSSRTPPSRPGWCSSRCRPA